MRTALVVMTITRSRGIVCFDCLLQGHGRNSTAATLFADWSSRLVPDRGRRPEQEHERRRVVVDPLEETEIRGEGWRAEVERESAGRG